MLDINIRDFPLFFSYLWSEKRMDFLTHIIILFVLPTLPYIILTVEILQMSNEAQIGFFGDGSMISLCIGIICTYFWKTHDFKEGAKQRHRFFNVVAIIIYIILLAIFMDCQISTPRSVGHICLILAISLVVLIITFIISLVLTFENYVEFEEFKQKIRLERADATVDKSPKSKTKIEV